MPSITSYHILWRALRSAHRSVNMRITASRKGGILYRARVRLKERFSLKVERGEGTACWFFDHKKRINNIRFYDGIESLLSKVWSKPRLLMQGIKQVYRHEIGHALYSPRDRSFFAQLKEAGIPFRLWNLFEDCRIEFKLWDEFKDLGLFYWFKYIEIGKDITHPTNALLEIKMQDAGARVARSKTLKTSRFFPPAHKIKYKSKFSYRKDKEIISKFYDRIISLKDSDTDKMILLLLEWVATYGNECEAGESSGMPSDAPYSESEIDKSSEEYAKEESEAKESESTRKDTDKSDKLGSVKKEDERAEGLEAFSVYKHFNPDRKVYAHRLFSQLIPIIKKARLSPEEIGRRGKLYVKRAMQGLADCFRSSTPIDGKRKVYLLLDMSGSMKYDYSEGLGQIASAFAKLRDSGLIDLKAYLTKGSRRGKVSIADLSNASPDTFLRLSPDGGAEFIKDALDKTKLALIESDSCFILTDGDIVDEPVEPNYWRSQGVDLVGVCVAHNDTDARSKRYHMDKHFSRSFISDAPSQLARRMLDYTINRKARV